jgi:hypothetical protein
LLWFAGGVLYLQPGFDSLPRGIRRAALRQTLVPQYLAGARAALASNYQATGMRSARQHWLPEARTDGHIKLSRFNSNTAKTLTKNGSSAALIFLLMRWKLLAVDFPQIFGVKQASKLHRRWADEAIVGARLFAFGTSSQLRDSIIPSELKSQVLSFGTGPQIRGYEVSRATHL